MKKWVGKEGRERNNEEEGEKEWRKNGSMERGRR